MNTYLVRYSGELGTKAANTRWDFIKILSKNLTRAIKVNDIPLINIEAGWDVVYLETGAPAHNILTSIPGVIAFSEVTVHEYDDLEGAYRLAAEHFSPMVEGKTYAVRCRMSDKDKLGIGKMEVERELGGMLVHLGKVDLTNPDITCQLEFRDGKLYLFNDRIPGMGGMPVGSLGKGLTLLSGGIDSPVAAWSAYRAGMAQHFIYFDLGGETQIDIAMDAARYVHHHFAPGARARLTLVDFKPVIKEILKANKRFHNLILKYFFYKAAERVAEFLHCDALVTGEALGQVSTQTLRNLATLDQITDLLIVRPLSTLPKKEIMAIAREIGTYDMAYKGKEYCAISGKGVVTVSTPEKLMAEVDLLDLSVMDKVLAEVKSIDLRNKAEVKEESTTGIPSNASIIDLRPSGQFEKGSLDGAKNIPFQTAWVDYPHWNKDDEYFLVCEVGSQSTILSTYMTQDGYKVSQLPGGMKAHLKANSK